MGNKLIDKRAELIVDGNSDYSFKRPPVLADLIPFKKVKAVLVNGDWIEFTGPGNKTVELWGLGIIVHYAEWNETEFYNISLIEGWRW